MITNMEGSTMKIFKWLAVAFAFGLVAAACGDSGGGSNDQAATTTEGSSATSEQVDVTQGSDFTFYVITHGDAGVFWSVAQRGAEDAGRDLGVTVIYQGSNNDPEKQAQDIEAAIAAGADGIAVSLASPDAVGPAVKKAVDAGIPVITLNSGVNQFKELGAITHVGQTETVAGEGAGERFNALGASTVLCARQEQSNIGLEERCDGLANTFDGTVISEFVGEDSDPTAQEAQISAILQENPDIDAVLGTGPNVAVRALGAGDAAGRDLIVGGFDISTEIIDFIESGDIAFTVDQQQYLQGYLPVVFLYLNKTNLNTVGGGKPVLTGPGFVTTENVGEVKALVEKGTR